MGEHEFNRMSMMDCYSQGMTTLQASIACGVTEATIKQFYQKQDAEKMKALAIEKERPKSITAGDPVANLSDYNTQRDKIKSAAIHILYAIQLRQDLIAFQAACASTENPLGLIQISQRANSILASYNKLKKVNPQLATYMFVENGGGNVVARDKISLATITLYAGIDGKALCEHFSDHALPTI